MAKASLKRKKGPLADPQVLLGIARKRRRRLNIAERQEVMFMLKLEGQVYTERQFTELFEVSPAQAHKDLKEVDERLTAYHRENGPDWRLVVSEYGWQYGRVLRALWDQYEEATRSSEKAEIAKKVFDVSDDFLNRMQEVGQVPRAPRHVEPGAVLLPLPKVSVMARLIFDAAAKVGLRGSQLGAFRTEVVRSFRAKDHEEALLSNGAYKKTADQS